MEEIKVGEYIRTDKGNIGKVIEKRMAEYKPTGEIINKYYLDNGLWTTDIYIKKHCPNIKDLVQAVDIVIYTINCKMTDIEIVKEHTDARTLKKTLRVGLYSLEQVDIKRILTKEQFNQMKYIVGE